jgi:hypothetical protein
MPEPSLVRLFTDRLHAAGIEYMVTGSVACIVYGEPRLTHDVDLVVSLRAADAEAVERAFPGDDFYVPPLEVLRVEQARALRGHFNIIHHDTGYKADVYVMGNDRLHAWAFSRRRRIPYEDVELVVAPPEYVIVRKLEFFREGGSQKHLDDIAGVLRVSAGDVDLGEVERLVAERGLAAEWAAARARVPQ